jgi:tRNA U34 5-carboxymethylaminomethyl modifying GTPase MnmE/TrmE
MNSKILNYKIKYLIMKLIIVGGPNVGKTTYIRLLNDEFKPFQLGKFTVYEEMMYYEDYELNMYEGADCAILMTTPNNYMEKNYKEKIKRYCGNIPIITVVNKIDEEEVKEKDDDKVYISCKEKINIYQPFEKLIQL